MREAQPGTQLTSGAEALEVLRLLQRAGGAVEREGGAQLRLAGVAFVDGYSDWCLRRRRQARRHGAPVRYLRLRRGPRRIDTTAHIGHGSLLGGARLRV